VAGRRSAQVRRPVVLGPRPFLSRGRSRNPQLSSTTELVWDQLAIPY
jgi:hypothetical protein